MDWFKATIPGLPVKALCIQRLEVDVMFDNHVKFIIRFLRANVFRFKPCYNLSFFQPT